LVSEFLGFTRRKMLIKNYYFSELLHSLWEFPVIYGREIILMEKYVLLEKKREVGETS
jgi:hypothetical protein